MQDRIVVCANKKHWFNQQQQRSQVTGRTNPAPPLERIRKAMFEPPNKVPPTPTDIPAIMASQYASALTLRTRRPTLNRRTRHTPLHQPSAKRKKSRADYQEILALLKQTCKKLKLHEHNLHISLLELPNGFLLKAYDCQSNRQICRQLKERFFHSSEKIENLVKEIMSCTGLLLDLSV